MAASMKSVPTAPVTFVEIGEQTGVPVSTLYLAVSQGLVTPDGPYRHSLGRPARTLSAEEAMFIILTAALAVAAGIAFMAMLRVMRRTGAAVDMESGTIIIPAPDLSVAA